jgi:hypothetical protein
MVRLSLALILAFAPCIASAADETALGTTTTQRYLVGIKHTVDPGAVLASNLLRGRRLDESRIEKVHHWPHPNHVDARHHIARVLLNQQEADALLKHSDIAYVETDGYVWFPEANNDGHDPLGITVPYPNDKEEDEQQREMGGTLSQAAQSSWALDRLDQANLPLDKSFNTGPYEGESVRIYIIDTGVRCDHDEFMGRCEVGMNFAPMSDEYVALGGDGKIANVDCHGHGTHTASTAAGTQWGVAKKAVIVPVRVMDCNGGGAVANIIDGMFWAIADAAEHPTKRSIISMSLLSGPNRAMNDAIKNAQIDGIVSSVAAGNYARDACLFSPAQESSALTVGATDDADKRSGFSNWGSCVDVFAPGSSIRGADAKSVYASMLLSGTSMSTPLVSGIVALILDKNPKLSAAQAVEYVKNDAEKYLIYNECEGSHNAIAQIPTELGPMDPDSFDRPESALPAAPWSYLADEPSVFLHWKDEFAVSEETYQQDGLCFIFQAKAMSGAPESAGVRLAVSSTVPFEKRVDMSTNEGNCDKPAATWYLIYADHGQHASVYKFDVKEESSLEPVPQMPAESETYWVRAATNERNILTLEFGFGDIPGNNTVVSHIDLRPPSNMLRLAFSSPEGHTMGYGAIRHCGSDTVVPPDDDIHFGHAITDAPTPRPTVLYSEYLAPRETGQFVAPKAEWTSESSGRACWQFAAVGAYELYVMLSTSAQGSDLLGTPESYVFAIGMEKGREVWMYRHRVLVAKRPMKPWLLHDTFARTLKVVLYGDGVVQLHIEGHLVFDYFDAAPQDTIQYLSLSAGTATDVRYTLIHDCSVGEEQREGGFGKRVPSDFDLPPLEARDCVKIPTRGRCWQNSDMCRWIRESDQCGVA